MPIIIAVIAAFAVLMAITRFNPQSATALGKVSAMVNTTAVLAEAWSKVQEVGRRMSADPASISVPRLTSSPASSLPVPVRRVEPDDDFYDEHPSLRPVRRYDAYAPFRP